MNHEEGVAIGPLFRFGQLFVQTIWSEAVATQHKIQKKCQSFHFPIVLPYPDSLCKIIGILFVYNYCQSKRVNRTLCI